MAKSSLIALATFGMIMVAAVISIVWLSVSDGRDLFEPSVGILGLLGGLAGILAERRTATYERRRLALVTLADELTRVRQVLAEFTPSDAAGRPRVYPRLPVSAVDAALVSGALTEPGDAGLVSRLHKWRDEANGFNRRLELTETRVLGVGATHEAADFHRALNGYLDRTRADLEALHQVVTTHLTAMSGRPRLRLRRLA